MKLADRRAKALRLRASGGSYRQIALALRGQDGFSEGYSEATAYRDVLGEIKRLNAEATETAEEVRRLELIRIDAMLAGVWEKATNGDPAAINSAVKLMDRRARYIPGVDVPTTFAGTLAIDDESGENYGAMSHEEVTLRLDGIVRAAASRGSRRALAVLDAVERIASEGEEDDGSGPLPS